MIRAETLMNFLVNSVKVREVKDSFIISITDRTFKKFGNNSCRADKCIYLISCNIWYIYMYNTLGKQVTYAEESTTTVPKKTNTIIRPVGEHFNLSGHKLEDTTAMFVSDRRQEE